MQLRFKVTLLIALAAAVLFVDVLVAFQADARFGTRRRTALVTAAVVSEKDKEAAAAAQQPAQAEEAPAAAKPEEAPQQTGGVPVGTIVHELPSGCTQTTVSEVAYQKCGADYYRAAFQGSELVYVASKP